MVAAAVGPHWVHLEACLDHVRKALALCPLEGRGYVHVAELSFLWTSDRAAERACVEQAMRVRPFDGPVLYAAANQAILAGNEPLWREYLKRAFRYGREQQQKIISDRVAAAPPDALPAVIADILHEFQPDLENADFLDKHLREPLLARATDAVGAVSGRDGGSRGGRRGRRRDAARLWLTACDLHRQLHERRQGAPMRPQRLAVRSGEYEAHYELGLCLLGQSQFAEAEIAPAVVSATHPQRSNVETGSERPSKDDSTKSAEPPRKQKHT